MAIGPPTAQKREPNAISVTEVRNALRCPRVFALGRALGQAVAFPVGASSLGALFHRIAEVFSRELASPPAQIAALPAGAPRDQVARALSAWLLGYLIAELEADPALPTMPAEVDDLAEALRELARYLAAEVDRSGRAPAEALRAMIQHAELAVDAVMDVASGATVRLSGRVDAVHCRAAEGADRDGAAAFSAIDVVEYKLTDEANQELDQAQVALYRHLLRRTLDLDAEPVVLRFNPGLIATRLSPAAGDALVERRLLPLLGEMVRWAERPEAAPPTARRDLCPACPVRAPCAEVYGDRLDARDQPPANAVRPRPGPEGRALMTTVAELSASPPADVAGHAEAEELGKLVLAELKRQAVIGKITRMAVGPSLLKVEVVSPRQRVATLDRAAKDVEHHLAERDVHFDREGARRIFTAPRKVPRKVELPALLAQASLFLRERPGRFVLGEGEGGEVIRGDLADGSTCHLLVGGQTGSGKSVLLRGIVSSLCHFHPPSAIRFTLVDPKRVTFGAFVAGIQAHLAGPILYDVEALLPELDDLANEMESRYDKFEKAKVQSIDEYNELGAEQLARRVVVVDEFQDLIAGRSTRQAFLDAVKRLGQMARAAGIHLILATQRPDRNTVPGEIKANLGGKIALKVQAAVNSRIILDQGGAERLLGRGDLLADLGHGLVRAQAPLA
ncbi:MAG TPA: FtsK/SpoIIIE domain-containing protein [Polyangiaceae bacterium]|nr:FtsK/SpoIIIE domain-containing protein [Polyangiaceae bacterium]